MDLSFLAQADAVTLQLEKAKRALEAAKSDLDSAKQAYDDILAQADEHGIPKAKLKKLTEERVNALFETGMVDIEKEAAPAPRQAKAEKPKKTRKVQSIGVEEVLPPEEGLNFDDDNQDSAEEVEVGHA